MSGFLERIGIELPVVQAGMGGGIARHELAAAVSEAGGLGTIGFTDDIDGEFAAARRLTGRPVAVNLLLPFARHAHRRAAAQADLIVTFWGKPRRPGPKPWAHQCGSVEEARAAHAAGADAVIVQGVEAGGHVRGGLRALELLEHVQADLPAGYPILLAGGIADGGDLVRALEAGATAGVLGTRFVLCQESRAHPEYKRRLAQGGTTVLTELFGLGWPSAPHRVLPNDATARWTVAEPRGPRWIRATNVALSPLARRVPASVQERLVAYQRSGQPLLSPRPPTDDGPGNLVDAGPLYAGETASRISDLRPAADLVHSLVPR
jgi:nitronate monooxygenase